MRVVVIHTAFIGDQILMTPLLSRLRENSGLDFLALVTIPAAVPIFCADPRLDALIAFDKRGADRGLWGLLRMGRRLRELKLDRVISAHRSLRSAILAYLSGAPERVGYRTATGCQLYTKLVEDDRSKHECRRILALLEIDDQALPSLYEDPVEEERVAKIFTDRRIGEAVALAPASVWPTKQWPPEYFAQLARKIVESTTDHVVLLGGPGDRALANRVAGAYHPQIHNLVEELSLRESYLALKRCAMAIVNDSAPLHLAQAAGIPTLAIFGSTLPAFGFGPQRDQDHIFEVELTCRPCGRHGYRKCPIGTFDCMLKIGVDTVFRRVQEVHSLLGAVRDQNGDKLYHLRDNEAYHSI